MGDSTQKDDPVVGMLTSYANYLSVKPDPVVLNRYMPDTNVVKSTGIGHVVQPIFAIESDNVFKRVSMLPGTHTAQTCALNAGLIYANQEYQKERDIKEKSIKVEEGLYVEVYNGYFGDNMDFFEKNAPIYTGISKNYSSISAMSNNQINQYNLYSIRLTGYIIFDIAGLWKFFTTSDDSSRVWIGDTAIDATTEFNMIGDDSGGHGMRLKSFSYDVKVDEVGENIPIRMVMGNGGGPSGFIFQYMSPQGANEYIMDSTYKEKTYLKVHTKDGKPYYNTVYYALLGDPKTNKLSCSIYGKTNIQGIKQGLPVSNNSSIDYNYLHTNINNGSETAAWGLIMPDANYLLSPTNEVYIADSYRGGAYNSAIAPGNLVIKTPAGEIPITFNNNNIYIAVNLNFNNANSVLTDDEARQYINNYPDLKNAYGDNLSAAKDHYKWWGINEGRVYTKDFKATIDSNGSFYMKDSKNSVIWSLHQVPNTSDSFANTQPGTQRIAKTTFEKIRKDAVSNTKWKNQYSTGTASHTLSMGQKLTVNGANGGLTALIDSTGKYKIQMSENGNLVLVTTNKIDSRTFTENSKKYTFTTYDDNMIYLNSVKAPKVMGKTFSVEKDKTTQKTQLSEVDTTSPFFSYKGNPQTGTDRYTKYDTMYPTGININDDSKISSDDCAKKCTPNEDCMFYYSYNYDGTDYCKTSKKDDIITFATKSDDKIKSSALYMKNPDLLYSTTLADPGNKMQNIAGPENYVKNKYPITNAQYKLNGESQIINSSKYAYYSELQNSLTRTVPGGASSSGIAGNPSIMKNSINTVKQSLGTNTDNQPKTVDEIKGNLGQNDNGNSGNPDASSSAPSTSSNQVGIQGFTNYRRTEGFFEGIEEDPTIVESHYSQDTIRDYINSGVDVSTIKEFIINGTTISSQSIPIFATNVGSVGTIGAMSELHMESHAKSYSNPKLIDLIGQDLFFYNFLNNKIQNNSVGSYNVNGTVNMQTAKSNKDNTIVDFLQLSNDINNRDINTRNQVVPSGNYVTLPSFIPKIEVTGDHGSGMTISFWVRSDLNKTYTRIMDFGNGQWQNNIIICLYGDYLYFIVVNNVGSENLSVTGRTVGRGINYGDWNHVCWTLSTDGIWMIYINGALVDYCYSASWGSSKTIDKNNVSGGGATYPNPNVNLTKCYIGKSNWWWDPLFTGGLSEFRIYNALISKEEIGYIYNTTMGNYNTENKIKSLNRGIQLGCVFDLTTIWQIATQNKYYSYSRNADGTSGDISLEIMQIYKRGYPDIPEIKEEVEYQTSCIVQDTTCNFKNCLKLDGTHFVNIKSLTLPANGMSFCVWVKAAPGANPNWSRIFDFGNGQGVDNIVMGIYNDSIAIHVQQGSNQYSQIRPDWYGVLKTSLEPNPSITKIADNNWHHLVWTLAPIGGGKSQWVVYLDGIKQAALPQDNLLYPVSNQLTKCFIGKSNWEVDAYLTASISDFILYSKVLTNEEVSTLYSITTMNNPSTGKSGFTNMEGFSVLGGSTNGMSYTSYKEGYTNDNPPYTPSFKYYDTTLNTANDLSNAVIANTYDKKSNLNQQSSIKTDFTYLDLQNNAYAISGLTRSYNNRLRDISRNYTDMSYNIDKLMDLSGQLSANAKYDFRGDKESSIIADIMYPGINPSTVLVLKNDVNELILQENTIYTIGVVTMATLLISTIFITGNK